MRKADTSDSGAYGPRDMVTERAGSRDNSKKRSYGFIMSSLGAVANYVGSVLILVIAIILSETLSGTAAQTA